jgi:cyclohexa-1,5-dienecarbonyl-CoA hydratase
VTDSRIVIERQNRLATIVLNRPPLNILDLPLITELEELLTDLATTDELQVLVLRGAGDKAFSAGVAVEDHTADKVEEMLSCFHGAIRQLLDLPAITIAAVRGHCLGGGMELAAGCDLVLASDGSRFGQPEIALGCFPPLAAALYPRRIGRQRTTDLLLSGRTITAREAVDVGFIARCLPEAELDQAVDEMTRHLLSHSSAVARLTKRAIRAGCERPFAEALAECEKIYLEELTETEDMHEGLAAFVDKRAPAWKHR